MKRLGKVVAALAVAVCTMFAGAATANAESADESWSWYHPITLSNVTVSDVGAHTATVSFDYTIDPAKADRIKSLCFSVWVQRITDITPVASAPMWIVGGEGGFYAPSCSGGVDSDLDPDAAASIWAFHKDKEYKGAYPNYDWDPDFVYAKASGQDAYRFYPVDFDGKLSGHVSIPLEGLEANTTYTNKNVTTDNDGGGCSSNDEACRSKRVPIDYPNRNVIGGESNWLLTQGIHTKTAVDIRQLVAYVAALDKDGNEIQQIGGHGEKRVPGFTTTSETEKPDDTVKPAVVDKTALQGTVDAAGKLVEKDYTAASWAGFAQALKAAQGVIALQDATQADVNAAVKALADAQAGLQQAAGTSTQGSDDTKQQGDAVSDKHANDGSDKQSDDTQQSDADASGQSALAETGVSVAAIVGVLVALIVAGIGVTVTQKVRHEI